MTDTNHRESEAPVTAAPVASEPPAPPWPGCHPLSNIERAALASSVKCALLELRAVVVQRVQRGEPIASVEGDLGPLVASRLRAVDAVLLEIDPSKALSAAAVVAHIACLESLRGDVAGLQHVLAVVQRPEPPTSTPPTRGDA